MSNQLIKISDNCWKHINAIGDIVYTKTSDIKSGYHREDGPAIEYAIGTKAWFIDGICHREDGAAIESTYGNKFWFVNGKCHREDGPAVEYANGDKEWYYNDQLINVNSQEEFEIYIKNLIFI